MVKQFLKIGPHLPNLLSNIKWLTFLEHGAVTMEAAPKLSNGTVFNDLE